MMYQYPFFGFPRRYYYYPRVPSSPNVPNNIANKKTKELPKTPLPFPKKDVAFENKSNDVLFEILGIKLYFDDILLICLIFFLYNEGVQDEYLFIALVLLLLS